LEKIDFSLNQLVEEVADLLAPTLKNKEIDFMTFLDPNLPKLITADLGKIRQILINLIGNAIKFTNSGEIEVNVLINETESEFLELEISVKDTGIGISKDKLDSIFGSFNQADNSTTRKFGGTGLGLSICRDLVELQNGRIWVESEKGRGSKFSFTLVVEAASDLKLRDKVEALQTKKALVVDDNKTNLKILVNTLSSWGMTSTPFNSPDLVISLKKSLQNFDVFILDMQMPEKDGITLAKEIKTELGDFSKPIILLSSMPE